MLGKKVDDYLMKMLGLLEVIFLFYFLIMINLQSNLASSILSLFSIQFFNVLTIITVINTQSNFTFDFEYLKQSLLLLTQYFAHLTFKFV